MPDALPADVAEVLGILPGCEDPVHVAHRRQLPHLSVYGRCTCGCGTAYFGLDEAVVQPATTKPGTGVAAAALIHTEDGSCPGEVLVFAGSGHLSWLEVCCWDDGIDVTLDLARRSLRR